MNVPVDQWHPDHRLQRITITIDYHEDGDATVLARGSTETKRASLWAFSETTTGRKGTLAVPDLVHWLVVAAHADRPSSDAALQRALKGGTSYGEDVPLF